MPKCDICLVNINDPSNLRRHRKRVHKIYPVSEPYSCFTCKESYERLSDVSDYCTNDHERPMARNCIFCKTVFTFAEDYASHMRKAHGLPTLDSKELQEENKFALIESAFSGAMRKFSYTPEHEMDLMHSLISLKPSIDEIIDATLQKYNVKLQMTASIDMIKHQPEGEEPEKITIYANTKMTPIYFIGLDEERFQTLVDQLVNTVNSFSSHGSGWTVEKIDKICLNLVRFSPMAASFYLKLPRGLEKAASYLLNIRNTNDNNCFDYCFTAAYHLKFGPSLYSEQNGWNEKTRAGTYKRDDAKKPSGDFEKPMSLLDIAKFELSNHVQVNVFRSANLNCLPMNFGTID